MIGGHPKVGMLSEDHGHRAEKILGVRVWGNKLCIPNQITLDPVPDDRSLLKRLEDGIRAIIGRPRLRPYSSESYPVPHRQCTIRTYMKKGARIVAMLRDPDQVVDSIRRRGQVTVLSGKQRWAEAIRIIGQVNEEYPDRICLIRFLDLVCHPVAVMHQVCKLLEVSYSPRMSEGYKYTPQYDYDQLDRSVATRAVESYNLQGFDSEAFQMYRRLAVKARRTVERAVR